jgi:hypothetical protein
MRRDEYSSETNLRDMAPTSVGFVQREWFSLFLSTSLGVLAAEYVDLLLRDHSFQSYLVINYLPFVTMSAACT